VRRWRPAITRTIVLVLPTNRPTGQHLRCSVDVPASRAKRAVDSGLAQAKG
jgi:LysR family nitrogen assimilation transcriptional regulator